jgi:hypothetical protein
MNAHFHFRFEDTFPESTVNNSAGLPERPIPWAVLVFTVLYLIPAVIGAVRTGNREFIFYIAVMLFLMAAVAVIHFRVGLSRTALWGLSLWGLAHMAGGLLPVPDSWPIHGDAGGWFRIG